MNYSNMLQNLQYWFVENLGIQINAPAVVGYADKLGNIPILQGGGYTTNVPFIDLASGEEFIVNEPSFLSSHIVYVSKKMGTMYGFAYSNAYKKLVIFEADLKGNLIKTIIGYSSNVGNFLETLSSIFFEFEEKIYLIDADTGSGNMKFPVGNAIRVLRWDDQTVLADFPAGNPGAGIFGGPSGIYQFVLDANGDSNFTKILGLLPYNLMGKSRILDYFTTGACGVYNGEFFVGGVIAGVY